MAAPTYLVSVIIPAWGSWTLTRACLSSLAEHAPTVPFQVVLVDNASPDATPDEAPGVGQSLFGDRFTYHRMPGNLGFAKACNQGAELSDACHLFFLNNDTILTAGWLPPLLDAMQGDKRLAGVGPLLLFPDKDIRSGRVQHLGIAVSHGPEFRHLYELFPADHPVVRKRRKLQAITAAALLMPAPLFQAHNGFHEGYVNGMEDIDLCCRIAEKGGHFSVIPDSIIYHHTSHSVGRFDHETENQQLLKQRCKGVPEDFAARLAEDGFEPAFTPWLDLVAALPRTAADALAEAHRHESRRNDLLAVVRANPLWDEGYELLVKAYLAGGEENNAIGTAYLRSLLCPSLESYHAHAEHVARLGNPDLTRRTREKFTKLMALQGYRPSLEPRFAEIERLTRDPAVRKALIEWRERELG